MASVLVACKISEGEPNVVTAILTPIRHVENMHFSPIETSCMRIYRLLLCSESSSIDHHSSEKDVESLEGTAHLEISLCSIVIAIVCRSHQSESRKG